MAWRQVMDAYEVLDSARADGEQAARLIRESGVEDVEVKRVEGERGFTDFVIARIPGSRGRSAGGEAPTLGIIGRLGGLGARPARIGFVSDGDGALTAIAAAMKLGRMHRNGDVLPGDVIVATHVCPTAPIRPHQPVPFMSSPVDAATMNRYEVDDRMEAILAIDTTRGNRILNQRGFALSLVIKEGYILPLPDEMLSIMSWVTGKLPSVIAIATQDITPYGNGLDHLNSIFQPSVATSAPLVGVALTAEVPVPGSATGAAQLADVESAARFCIEVGKAYGGGECRFYDEEAFDLLRRLYGDMRHLQTVDGRSPDAVS